MPETVGPVPNIVTLLGGGPVEPMLLEQALEIAPYLVAADGGANYAEANQLSLNAIVGDFDSVDSPEIWQDKGVNLVRLDEQETTDFEKCIYSTDADTFLCVGFLGGRLDHSLAALRTLVAYPDKRIILMGGSEITFRCPNRFAMELSQGDRVSLFPMETVQGVASTGLKWPIDDITFSPSGRIGVCNEALGGPMSVTLDGAAMLMILQAKNLAPTLEALEAVRAGAPAR